MSRIVKLIIGILIISLTQFCSSGLAKVRYFSVSDIKQPIVGSYTNLGIFTDKVCEPLNPKDKEVTPLSVVFLVFKIVYWPFTLIYYAFDNALKKSEDLTIKYTNYNSQYEVSSKLSQLSLRETLILEKIPEADLVILIGERQYIENSNEGIEMGCKVRKLQALKVEGLLSK